MLFKAGFRNTAISTEFVAFSADSQLDSATLKMKSDQLYKFRLRLVNGRFSETAAQGPDIACLSDPDPCRLMASSRRSAGL